MDRRHLAPSPLDLGKRPNVERRIGARVATEGVEAQWILPEEIDLRDEIDRRDGAWLGRFAEVSVTGAAIDASSSVPLRVAATATLRYGTTESSVVIRHASPTGEPDVTRFGIEWTHLEDPLRRVVYGIVADARGVTA